MWSIPLAGIGLLLIAMVLVRGQSFWYQMRQAIFGVLGITTYFAGPLLLYLAYLVASGYNVRTFVGKTLLMALMVASVPVVFSDFTIGDVTFVQVIKMLYSWGQTHMFWSGGVFGGVIGATLLALCGRPAANIVMVLLFLVGLMVFFAVTPLDVVQFVSYYVQKFKEERAAAAAEETAYDTPLFEQPQEEEAIENLTGALPPSKNERRPFDVEPYLEVDDTRRKQRSTARNATPTVSAAEVCPQPAAPVVPATPAQPAASRSEFDVDLGPDPVQQQLDNALKNDPLEPVVIGPGGTFGLDPLEQALHHKPPKQRAASQPEPQPEKAPADDFELYLNPFEEETESSAAAQSDEISDLIEKAMGVASAGRAGNAQAEDPIQVNIDLPQEYEEDTVSSEIVLSPGEREDSVSGQSPAGAIPTIGGSFDVAKAAWNAGIPMTDVLAGRPVPAPAQATQSRTFRPVQNKSPMGNSAVEPITTPPKAGAAADAAMAGAATAAVADKAEDKDAVKLEFSQEIKPYCYPSVNLFNPPSAEDDAGAAREMKKNAEILVNTLDSFGVKTRIMDICRGPSVTRYELQPQAGVKISRITNLSDDIALNLATAGVRIEAPIPGKPAVGIEVPNRIRSAVNIRSVFESQNYINMRSPLTMALGKDIAGTAQVADLCKMPHLLIAGSTGSGKSVCVNSIIISFLFRSSPEDCKLILIDPKVVELAEYNGIPHLLMPVVTEPRKAAGALGASVAEMERRYKLFAENNVRDIKSYNKLAKSNPELQHLPYIAIVIDELADLMMVAGKEVEDYICRIAQKARAAGIHLIIATQRPSVDVITGLIKANIPSRIAFAVSSQIDSRTILDSGGAEKLLGNGDMLFLPVGAAKPTRIQGTFVTDEEISAVLNFIKATSSTQYDEEMIAEMERRAVAEGKNAAAGADDADGGSARDAMFEQAVECVIEAGQASTSLLQRRCKLGYARAARIMDEMEQEKIIGPYEGAKPRAVLITKSQWQERKLGAGNEEE